MNEPSTDKHSSAVETPGPPPGLDPLGGWTRWVMWIGFGIFLVNMGLAWRMAESTSTYIREPLLGERSGAQLVLKELKHADLAQAMIYRRIIEGQLHMKAISNRQTTIVVGVAAGFGFLAVGLALVIMAIRGSFQLAVKAPSKAAELALRSASPGVLCFALGALVIVVALFQESKLEFGEMTATSRVTEGVPAAAEPASAPPIPNIDPLPEPGAEAAE